jgi:hypothetical protein
MRDRILIYSGLFVFIVLVIFPFTGNFILGNGAKKPVLRMPAGEKRCVAPAAYMKSSHMQLLVDWRESRVRKGIRTYTGYDGRSYEVALTGTCLGKCHENKADFCDRCHRYVGVQGPYCMDCHVDPAKIQRGGL